MARARRLRLEEVAGEGPGVVVAVDDDGLGPGVVRDDLFHERVVFRERDAAVVQKEVEELFLDLYMEMLHERIVATR